MKLVICRHGETDFNVEKRLQGRLETPINDNGKRQAALVSDFLKDEKFDRAFCSPQKRCKMTAEIILRHHKDVPVEFRDELREIDVGIYTGLGMNEIEEKYPKVWASRVDNKYDFLHGEGESYKEMDEGRVRGLLNEFREKYSSRKILAITHQGTGRLILGSMLGLSGVKKMRIDFPNDCIYFVEYRPHKTVVNYYVAGSKKSGKGYLER